MWCELVDGVLMLGMDSREERLLYVFSREKHGNMRKDRDLNGIG